MRGGQAPEPIFPDQARIASPLLAPPYYQFSV